MPRRAPKKAWGSRRTRTGTLSLLGRARPTHTFRRRRRANPHRKQARLNFSSSTYKLNKAISKAMSRMSETKLIACTKINRTATAGNPTAVISTGSPAVPVVTAWRGVLASVPQNWDTGLVDLAGIFTSQGNAMNQHIGSYIYLKKTQMSFQIDMTFTDNAAPPVQFRLIVAKARQAVTPAGTTEYPQDTLFLQSSGPATGHAALNPDGTSAMNSFEIMRQPLNKRDWVILRDQKFTLSHPFRQNYSVVTDSKGNYVVPTSVGYSGKYPNRKDFNLRLPHYAKTRLNESGHPLNYDSRYVIYLYATSIGSAGHSPIGWTVAARGTTSYTDN